MKFDSVPRPRVHRSVACPSCRVNSSFQDLCAWLPRATVLMGDSAGRSGAVICPVWSRYWSEASISPIENLIALITVPVPVSYTHLRAHETRHDLVCRLLLEKKKR